MEGETYYSRNRDRILADTKARYDPLKTKAYNQQYYLKNKDKIKQRQRERSGAIPRKPAQPKAPAGSRGRPRKTPAPESVQDKRKIPREYIVYQTDELEEPKPFGYPTKPHQIAKLQEICPQGFFQPAPSSNPFVLTFSP